MTARQGRVAAVFAPFYPPAVNGGGPIRSTEALARTAPAGVTPLVLTSDRDLGEDHMLPVVSGAWVDRDGVAVRYSDVSSLRGVLRALRALRARRPDLLSFNSFWNPRFTILPLMLGCLGFWGRPDIVIAPRGEFGEGAMGRRAAKKRLYLGLFRALRLHRGVVWHSTAPQETIDIRSLWGDRARIVERENDAMLAPWAAVPSQATGALRLAYVGRIVEHKGLDIVLRALGGVRLAVTLDIYGIPEDPAYLAKCRELADRTGDEVIVRFCGPVAPDRVVETLNRHDAVVLPTRGENFGHVIVESLAASCIMLVTPMTPWTEVVGGAGGIIVPDRSVDSWRAALEGLASADADVIKLRRRSSGAAYEAWARQPRAPHVWDLARAITGRA